MKTGRPAEEAGVYVSECCEREVFFDKGMTLTRCPGCSALTIWNPAEEEITTGV